MTSAQDFLMSGGGAKAAKFPTAGTAVSGPIVREPEVAQQTEFGTGKPLFWDDGKPRNQLVVQIQTDQRDDSEDDGVRSIYIKGKSLTNAVREAVKAAGAPGLEVGGVLTITYTGDGKAERGMPPKLYTAQYRRATAQAANTFLAASEPAPAPAGLPDLAGVLAQLSPEQRAALLAQQSVSAISPPY
jgi:hypothetical protein